MTRQGGQWLDLGGIGGKRGSLAFVCDNHPFDVAFFFCFLDFSYVPGAVSIGVWLRVFTRLLGYGKMWDHLDEMVGGG